MSQIEEQTDLAVQEELDSVIELEEVDIHLARANLLRMRGEYDSAKDVCRSILKSFPHQAFAHAMLGDIAVEQNEIESPVHAYELACEYDPGYAPFVQKLASARKRKGEHEAAEAARKLGYGAKGWSIPSLVIMLTMVLAALAISAFALGRTMGERPVKIAAITDPVIIQGIKPALKEEIVTTVNSSNELNVIYQTAEEGLIVKAIQEKLRWNNKLVGTVYDATSSTVILSYLGETDENGQQSADKFCSEAASALPDIKNISLRYFVSSKLVASSLKSKESVVKSEPSSDNKIKNPDDSETKVTDGMTEQPDPTR